MPCQHFMSAFPAAVTMDAVKSLAIFFESLAIFLNLLRFFSVAESLPIFSWDKIRSEIEPYSYIRRESM